VVSDEFLEGEAATPAEWRAGATLVALFVMVIIVPGTTAPVESVTVPVIVPTGAWAHISRIVQQSTNTKSKTARLDMMSLPFFGRSLWLRWAGVNDSDNILHFAKPVGSRKEFTAGCLPAYC
jgi:hypothetical protein